MTPNNPNAETWTTEAHTAEETNYTPKHRLVDLVGLPEDQVLAHAEQKDVDTHKLTSDEIALRLTPVPESVLTSSIKQDSDVREEYAETQLVVNSMTPQSASRHHEIIKKMGIKHEEIVAESLTLLDTLDRACEVQIRAFIAQTERKKAIVAYRADTTIQDIEAATAIATELHDSQAVAISELNKEIKNGIARQADNEQNRLRALKTIEEKIARYHELEARLNTQDASRDEAFEKLTSNEYHQSIQIAAKTELMTKIEKEKRLLVSAYRTEQNFENRFPTEDGEEPAGVKSQIADYRDNVTTPELTKLNEKLELVEIELKSVNETIKANKAILKALDVEITANEAEQTETLRQLANAWSGLDTQLSVNAPARFKHSSTLAKITKVQSSIIEGNTSPSARMAVPPALQALYKLSLELGQALDNLSSRPSLQDPTLLEFDIDEDLVLESGYYPDEVTSLEQEIKMIETIESQDKVVKIRNLFKPGANLLYKISQSTQNLTK